MIFNMQIPLYFRNISGINSYYDPFGQNCVNIKDYRVGSDDPSLKPYESMSEPEKSRMRACFSIKKRFFHTKTSYFLPIIYRPDAIVRRVLHCWPGVFVCLPLVRNLRLLETKFQSHSGHGNFAAFRQYKPLFLFVCLASEDFIICVVFETSSNFQPCSWPLPCPSGTVSIIWNGR